VVRFTFQVIRRNLLRFLGLSAIVTAPAVLFTPWEAAYPNANLWDLPLALPLAVEIVAATLLTAIITRMIVPDSAGHYHPLAKSIQPVINDFAALAMIGLFSNVVILLNIFAPILVRDYFPDPYIDQVTTVVLVLGITALVLLGLFLTVLLAMLIPVRTIEQTDFVRTFVRGAELTRGNRWPIFGLTIAMIVLAGVGEGAVYIIVGDPLAEGAPSNGAASILGRALVATAVSVTAATGTAVLYCELRRIKDGPAPRELALEFD